MGDVGNGRRGVEIRESTVGTTKRGEVGAACLVLLGADSGVYAADVF